MTRLRLAMLPDFPEEGWPSMDLCAEMLERHWPTDGPELVRVTPKYARFARQMPFVGRRRAAVNADRLYNRFVTYPRFARQIASDFDAFHVVDHSYAAVVSALPPGRAGALVHDLDAFRSVLTPTLDPRPRWYRAMTRRVLAGLKQAAVVFVTGETVRDELLSHRLVDPARVRVAPVGVAEEFTAEGPPCPDWLAGLTPRPWIAHVGSCIPRKRVDVLLDVVARLRARHPDLQLLKVGGEFTAAQREQISRLSLGTAITHVHGLTRPELAAVYRAAPVVVQPSDAEGFGLPVAEALACGAAVVASDIPTLREVGGAVVRYAAVGDVDAWVSAVESVLANPGTADERAAARAWAGRYSWAWHAEVIAEAYEDLVGAACASRT